MTQGKALWELDRPVADFPNRKPFEQLDERQQQRYEDRAFDIIVTANKILALVRSGSNTRNDLLGRCGIGKL
jgi:hypothetical protein